MGRRADKLRSARRPGKRERARVKKNRSQVWTYVPGVGTVHAKYGRKHAGRGIAHLLAVPSGGEPVKPEKLGNDQMARL